MKRDCKPEDVRIYLQDCNAVSRSFSLKVGKANEEAAVQVTIHKKQLSGYKR